MTRNDEFPRVGCTYKDELLRLLAAEIDRTFVKVTPRSWHKANPSNAAQIYTHQFMHSHSSDVLGALTSLRDGDDIMARFKAMCRNGKVAINGVLMTPLPDCVEKQMRGELGAWHWVLRWLKEKEKEDKNNGK